MTHLNNGRDVNHLDRVVMFMAGAVAGAALILGVAVSASQVHAAEPTSRNHTAAGGRITVSAHGVVGRNRLRDCREEDGSGSHLPCYWSDGSGLSLWYDVNRHRHYVWPVNPVRSNVGPRLRWVNAELADALVEGQYPDRTWRRCVYNENKHGYVVACPDGLVIGANGVARHV